MAFRFDKGKLMNPSARTDSSGKFKIIVDRRVWKETGKFALGIYIGGIETYLQDSNDIPIVVKADEEIKTVDLGDITVKR